MSVDDLRPYVMDILHKSDLTQISSKAVRSLLAERYAAHIPAGVDLDGDHKKQVTALIKDCFHRINDPAPPAAAAAPGLSLPGTGGVRGGLPAPVDSKPEKPKAKSKKRSAAAADADEGASSKPAKKAPRKKKAKAADDPDAPPKKKRPANPNNPFNRPLILDEPLREVCGVEEAPRFGIVKLIWAYIKGNKLQDPNNGRTIICDEKMLAVFGKPKVDSFEIVKLLGSHITPKPMPPGGFPVPKEDEDGEQPAEA